MKMLLPKNYDQSKYLPMVKPCRNGHLSVRYVCSGACWACQDARRAKYRSTPKGKELESIQRAKTYHSNPEKFKERARNWNKDNPGVAGALSKKWRSKNPEKVKSYSALYVRENRSTKSRLAAAYSARKKRAMASWADQEQIARIYAEAERISIETGIAHEVDHVVPLKGKLVCGLHVENNLQIITKTENRRKYNSHG